MLTELSDLQESDESVWGATKVSFTIETRSEPEDELIHREYTFSRAPEWDKWTFQEFEEKKTDNTESITDRNWRRERHIIWDDAQTATVSVPPEVSEELEEILDIEKLVIQNP